MVEKSLAESPGFEAELQSHPATETASEEQY
jgi:hypothetical protein